MPTKVVDRNNDNADARNGIIEIGPLSQSSSPSAESAINCNQS
jgi:hypothetical protein